jgi:hypothetical protein
MNTSLLHRALSLSFAAALTMATLAAVDVLATQQPSAALLAHAAATARV